MGEARTSSRRRGRPRAAAMLLLAFALGLGAPPAAAQDDWVAQVRSLMQRIGRALEERGYTMTHRLYTGSLNNGAQENVSVELEGGREYQLAGVCDNDCSDLDLVAFDGQGNEVNGDREMDDHPMVGLTTAQAGTWRVQVIMASCSADPCRYGLAVFAK